MSGRPWLPAEIAEAARRFDARESCSQIGRALKRSEESVRAALRRHHNAILDQGDSLVKDIAAPPPSPNETTTRLPEERVVVDAPRIAPADAEILPEPPRQGGVAPWVRKTFDHYLLISDPQLPYQHPGALRFVQEKRREWAIPLDNILCVGDEFDLYFASRFEKSPDSPHTAKQEIEAGREEVQRWVAAFPKMRLCYSNHGGRLRQAAHRAGLPAQLVRNVKEIFGLPEEWRYADHWIVKASKLPFRVEHGHVGPGGHSGLRGRPLNRGMPTAWGHEHAEPAAIHVDTHGGLELWGMRVGSLIAKEALPAFEYNGEQGSRPVGSIGIVINGGRTPIVERM